MFDFLARLHLLLLHLPIGILALGAVLEMIARWRQRPAWRPAIQMLLFWGMVSALFTAFCGWLLAGRGDYDPVLLTQHKYWGFGVAWLSVAVWWLRNSRWYFPVLLACVVATVGAGHVGGSLTHGKGYLLVPFEPAPVTIAAEGIAAPPPEAVVYQALVQPILRKKCVSCHNSSKNKGRLLLNTPDNIRQGGAHGAVLVPGKPMESELLRRALLPMSDEHHMPPAGKVPLSRDEITVLSWWIAQGADFQRLVRDEKISPAVEAVFKKGK